MLHVSEVMPMRRSLIASLVLLALAPALVPVSSARQKPTLTPAEYDLFESVSPAGGRGGLSADGRWLAYSIATGGGDSTLHVEQVVGTVKKTVPFAFGVVYAPNSQWIAYNIGVSRTEQERLTAQRQPTPRKVGILNLATQQEVVVEGIDSFAFDRAGMTIAMRRASPAAAAGGAAPPVPAGRGGAAAPAAASTATGRTVLVRDLASAATTTFGNVAEFAWQSKDAARLLAIVVSADSQAGNGVQLYDASSGVLRVLETEAADYSALSWRDDSDDLLVVRAKTDDEREGPTQVLRAWTGVGTSTERSIVLDHTTSAILPAGQRVVTSRRPSWIDSADNAGLMVMIGVAEWPERQRPPAGGRGRAAGAGAAAAGGAPTPAPARGGGPAGAGAGAATNERPDVEVWHWNDARVMPVQKLQAAADRRRSLPAVWHVGRGAVVVLGTSFDESISPIRGTTRALVSDPSAYLMERSIGRGAADWFVTDLNSGAREPLRSNVGGNLSASTGGRYALFAQGGHYWTIDLATKAVTNITAGIRETRFQDLQSDSTAPEKPMFGVAGWTASDESILLYDRLDIWRVSPAGEGGTRLTNGLRADYPAGYVFSHGAPRPTTPPNPVRHRLFNLGGQPGQPLDPDRAWVALFNHRTKQSGYARFSADAASVAPVVYLDKSVGSLAKAEDADVYTYTVQAADDPPDLFVGGADLAAAKPATSTNAFLDKYAWTRAELVDYVASIAGRPVPLQGILHYPANYEAGKTYPMVVYLYEKLSDGLHRFQAPSERSYYDGMSLTQNGYFFFQPDIQVAPREPGVSVVQSVSAAVNAVVKKGAVDAKRIGVMGHSWGGFDAMYLATHSTVFAAAVSGAGISNLISNYGNHHWQSGIAETDHIETGQQRMVVPLYEDLQAYIRNSAVFGVHRMTTPLLLMTGDNDGTVYWHQSVELYNIARRAKKPVIMLVYNGENHGLAQRRNQVDYHRRIRQWFDHYLKHAPAEKWITDGVPALDREGR
jgi:dipeptidyl aminopeptidase/acylaminoacyl peptidase